MLKLFFINLNDINTESFKNKNFTDLTISFPSVDIYAEGQSIQNTYKNVKYKILINGKSFTINPFETNVLELHSDDALPFEITEINILVYRQDDPNSNIISYQNFSSAVKEQTYIMGVYDNKILS